MKTGSERNYLQQLHCNPFRAFNATTLSVIYYRNVLVLYKN